MKNQEVSSALPPQTRKKTQTMFRGSERTYHFFLFTHPFSMNYSREFWPPKGLQVVGVFSLFSHIFPYQELLAGRLVGPGGGRYHECRKSVGHLRRRLIFGPKTYIFYDVALPFLVILTGFLHQFTRKCLFSLSGS